MHHQKTLTDVVLGKGVEELTSEFAKKGHSAGFLSCTIAILYFLTIHGLETIGSSTIWRPAFRGLLADYAYPVCLETELGQMVSVIAHTSHSLGLCFGWDSHISLDR